MSAMLDAAISYRRHGVSVIPFRPLSNRPAFAQGQIQRYRRNLPSEAQLRRWFAHTDKNVGLITGSISRLLVLDIDGDIGEYSIKGLPMPPTPMVFTPRPGRHAYFQAPDQPIKTTISALPKVDIISEGYQVVAPPSVRPKGC
jgi:putative DNA primase/helicase